MVLDIFKEIKFIAFFCWKIQDWKVDKNELNFNKQYVKKKTHFEKIYLNKCKKNKTEII